LPIVQLQSCEPPTIIANGKTNPLWTRWAKELAAYAKRVASHHGLPLSLITIDPQNMIAGFRDEQSSAEGQVVSNALWALSRDADCMVLVVDHYGKNVSAGLRGTSVKETSPLLILSTGETVTNIYAQRMLTVDKLRNGRANVGAPFVMRDVEVTTQQDIADDGAATVTFTGKTLAVEWLGGLRPLDLPDGAVSSGPSPQQRRALTVLSEMINGRAGQELPPGCEAPAGMRGVKLDSWKLRLIDKTVLEGKHAASVFSRLKRELLDAGEIDVGQGFVWVPLPR
jgi:hypothetical protein